MIKSDHGVSEWYNRYKEEKGNDRNDLLRNPGVLFQAISQEVSIINAVRFMNLSPEFARVLDVGCGEGWSTEKFIRLGFEPGNIYGIDILKTCIRNARKRYPNINFFHGDASRMPFQDQPFDLVCESTMFVQIIDDVMAKKIANEMMRVTKPGGYLMLADWRYNKPGHPEYNAFVTVHNFLDTVRG
jgi:ubiquinone/menaquinone biosynthesis C-methylase UbiE